MPSAGIEPNNGGSSIFDHHRILWIVRHGQRVDNVDPQWRAKGAPPRGEWDDPPLSARGVVQASEVGAALASEPIHWIICSPFTRCLQTAQQILRVRRQNDAHPTAVPSICIEPGFAESLNACQSPAGFPTMTEILQCFSDLHVNTAYRPFIGADQLPIDERTSFCCFRRVIATLRHILNTFSGNVLIVSHGTPIAALHFALSGELNYPGQCTISKYRIAAAAVNNISCGGHFHWTDRWTTTNGQTMAANGTAGKQRKALPPMGPSVALLVAVEEPQNGQLKAEQDAAAGNNNNSLWLHEALASMAPAVSLCADVHAECMSRAEASHLSERDGLHDAMVLRCCSATADGLAKQKQTNC